MNTTDRSFLAILKNGMHLTFSLPFTSHDVFKKRVRAYLAGDEFNIERFFYAWGHEAQEYTGAEVREVFFGEGK